MGFTTENHNGVYRSRKKMLMDNFLGGMMWSLGTLIGGAIIVVILGIIVSQIDLVPIIGGWLSNILSEAFRQALNPKGNVKGIYLP